MSTEFVVVGEALVDIVVTSSGQTSEEVGGSPMNVAVGLARLGVPTVLITEIGGDERGRRIAEHVRTAGVRMPSSSIRPTAETSTATATLDANHAADYDFELSWSLPRQRLPEATGLHVGSLGASLRPGREAVLDLVRQATDRGLLVTFDPNVRPAFVTDPTAAWADLTETAALSTLVKVSDEDLHALRPGDPVPALAAELLATERTELVIVTRGGDGATAFTVGRELALAAPRIEVVDTVGAGDSFMAATLAILCGWKMQTAAPGTLAAIDDDRLRLLLGGAMDAAAVTCSRRGANSPMRGELAPGWPGG